MELEPLTEENALGHPEFQEFESKLDSVKKQIRHHWYEDMPYFWSLKQSHPRAWAIAVGEFPEAISCNRQVDRKDWHGEQASGCGICLDLDWNSESLYGSSTKSYQARMFKLRISGWKGCKSCLILYNGIAHFCQTALEQVQQDREALRERMSLNWVHIHLRQGYTVDVDLEWYGEYRIKIQFYAPEGE